MFGMSHLSKLSWSFSGYAKIAIFIEIYFHHNHELGNISKFLRKRGSTTENINFVREIHEMSLPLRVSYSFDVSKTILVHNDRVIFTNHYN